jgi:acyl carrier protein
LPAACESIVGVHPIGTRDNLFDLGADSLALLQLTAHIEAEFGTNLPPSAIFASPTIADLAHCCVRRRCRSDGRGGADPAERREAAVLLDSWRPQHPRPVSHFRPRSARLRR